MTDETRSPLPPEPIEEIVAHWALLEEGWVPDVRLRLRGGIIETVLRDAPDPDAVDLLLPGFHNAHAQSFLWSLRGRLQYADAPEDELPWRNAAMEWARKVDLSTQETTASLAYRDMAQCGVVHVAEMLWIHHDRDGEAHSEPAQVARMHVEAARRAGLHLTLVPTYFGRSDYGQTLDGADARFAFAEVDAFLTHVEAIHAELAGEPDLSFALGAHGLDTVDGDALQRLFAFAAQRGWSFHVPVAAFPRDVERCVEHTGLSPVAYLHSLGVLQERTTLIHALHLSPSDQDLLAASGARICACPTTERDLGAGLRPTRELWAAGVPMCIGSGANTIVDPRVEMLLLEAHERLRLGRRIALVDAARGVRRPSSVVVAWATAGGAAACGRDSGVLAEGKIADVIALRAADKVSTPAEAWDALDRWLYCAVDVQIDGTWVSGVRRR